MTILGKLSLKKINNEKVKKIHLPKVDTRPIRGYNVCPELYSNVYFCARKKSGKTSALFKMLKACMGKDTKLVVFCSTVYKDPNWIEIRRYFENLDIDVEIHTSIRDDGEDQLLKFVEELNEDAINKEGDELDEPEVEKVNPNSCDNILQRLRNMNSNPRIFVEEKEEEQDKPKKKRKSKYQAPEYIIVFDDLADELKTPSLFTLLKKNRHYKTKIIISSQWINDLFPQSRKQLDLIMLFKGFNEKKLEEIHKDCDTRVPLETFLKIYKIATKKPFSFLYIDTRSDTFRRNFNREFVIKDDEDEDQNDSVSDI